GFSGIDGHGEVPRPDVVIVARGGGSIEDLWSFNEEIVVRAIAECTIPVISAVGHETDTTLSDYAADRRAPTPTAAAETAVPVRIDLEATLADFAARQRRAVHRPVELGRERLEARVRRMPRPEALLQPQTQRLDELNEGLRRGLTLLAGQGREQLAGAAARLSPAVLQRAKREADRRLGAVRLVPGLVERPIAEAQQRLSALARLASQLHPEKPLERGYAIVRGSDGSALTSRVQAEEQARLALQFRDGAIDVAPLGKGPQSPARKARKPKPSDPASAQEDLFG
ncbi:MAG: exodeoxyribonuclease VII large subunit, partial [Pseudomonadota bacterium]